MGPTRVSLQVIRQKELLESEGGQATVVEVDVSVADQVDAAVTKLAKTSQ